MTGCAACECKAWSIVKAGFLTGAAPFREVGNVHTHGVSPLFFELGSFNLKNEFMQAL